MNCAAAVQPVGIDPTKPTHTPTHTQAVALSLVGLSSRRRRRCRCFLSFCSWLFVRSFRKRTNTAINSPPQERLQCKGTNVRGMNAHHARISPSTPPGIVDLVETARVALDTGPFVVVTSRRCETAIARSPFVCYGVSRKAPAMQTRRIRKNSQLLKW